MNTSVPTSINTTLLCIRFSAYMYIHKRKSTASRDAKSRRMELLASTVIDAPWSNVNHKTPYKEKLLLIFGLRQIRKFISRMSRRLFQQHQYISLCDYPK